MPTIRPLTAIAILASVAFVSPGRNETWFFVPEPGQHNPLVAEQTLEDEPGWDCATMGNRRCGAIETDTGAFVGGYN
jgi:hypothetical protein